MLETRKQIVKIIAKERKYRDHIFFCVAPFDPSTGKYLTGQENCSQDEIEKLKEKGIWIDPNLQYPVMQHMTLDKNKEKDIAIINLFRNVEEIANSKSEIIPGVTLFYMEDVEIEAENSVTLYDKRYEAETKVRENTTINKLADLCMLLGVHDIKQLTPTMMQDRIFKICSENPDRVLECFNPASKDRLFMLKLLDYGILYRNRNNEIYYHEVYVGRSIEEAMQFLSRPSNSTYKDKWMIQLEDTMKSGIISTSSKAKNISTAIEKNEELKKKEDELAELKKRLDERELELKLAETRLKDFAPVVETNTANNTAKNEPVLKDAAKNTTKTSSSKNANKDNEEDKEMF